MKKLFPLVLAFSFIAVLSCGCASPQRGGLSSPAATVAETEGTAEIRKGDAWRTLKTGTRVRQGDSLRTGVDSAITLNFGEYGGVMRLTPDTQITLQQFDWTNTSTGRVMHVIVDLQRGRVRGDTLNPAPNSRFQLKTLGGTFDLK